ncbi:hypothetical protein [Eubacterium oxidoreducens]|uniref:AAA domain-containing protein n=1 Tax=Eubacterium oxidoreducens TaxID=1732 RepID=A0A1G6B2I8_EUBOX|nr:hypothetical protein [Eubacterium oxidoreducens]SDB14673.1 hypothetical protein SAMN02910417_01067 [Eubacterium oxidoreducens]
MLYLCYPASGKTFNASDAVLDLDSHSFATHKGWQKEFVDAIEENLPKYTHVLASFSHEIARECVRRNLDFIAVLPRMESKEMMIGRYLLRGGFHHLKWIKRRAKMWEASLNPQVLEEILDGRKVQWLSESHPYLEIEEE